MDALPNGSRRPRRGGPSPRDCAVSSRMRRQKTAGTSPERELGDALRRCGFRIELNPADLPGRPDVVLPVCKVAVFVHGCFWHGCRFHFTLPKHNRKWWKEKIAANKKRDRDKAKLLRGAGWRVVTVWEHTDVDIAVKRIREASRK